MKINIIILILLIVLLLFQTIYSITMMKNVDEIKYMVERIYYKVG